MSLQDFKVPYEVDHAYSKAIAYFSMEFAIHQRLKIYSGGLGFLAGSHVRSAYELRQNFIAVGILWKYGYYDQARNPDQTLQVAWTEKQYSFLEDHDIKFQITVHNSPVWVKALYLSPGIFNTVPLFLLTTDVPENDYLSQTITHRLYDSNLTTKLAQFMLLGIGGAKLLDEIGFVPERYHLNEAHGISSAFYLYKKFNNDIAEVKKRLVFTTHTPEEAGNEKHDIRLCHTMGYFCGLGEEEASKLTGMGNGEFNHSLAALRLARMANAVSRLHGEVSKAIWSNYADICPITSITNAQNRSYWADKLLYEFGHDKDDRSFDKRKKNLKKDAFDIVADQTGKVFNEDVFTIVWARRFAEYKRPSLITSNYERKFEKLISNKKYPVQIIWAGKPYPGDTGAINEFNRLVHMSKGQNNIAVLTGYELDLSKKLKQAADCWLNNPCVFREASGTSGMTAAMNGAVNLSTEDGWIPEFIRHGINGFVVPKRNYAHMQAHERDYYDFSMLYYILENEILPLFYENFTGWRQIMKNGMIDVVQRFESNRMAHEYYEILYK
jgi:glycogen phosphorylase